MIKIIFFFGSISILFFTSCEKKDIETTISIKGMVNNFATDKGIGGVKIYFSTIYKNKKEVLKMETVSKADGTFVFDNVIKHSSDRYTHSLVIKSVSAIGTTETYFAGAGVTLENNKLENNHNFFVVPGAKKMCFQLSPPITITSPDTLTVYCEQRTMRKNLPNSVFDVTYTPMSLLNEHCTWDYPMGWWHLTIDKTKSGIRTIVNDSIYVDWGGTVRYTVQW
jgi:hypothetical protein